METSVLTPKGQLLIPKRIRTKYGIKAGVKVIFEETENGLIIRAMNEDYFNSFKGIFKGAGNLKEEMKEMKDEEKRLEDKKLNLLFGKKTIK